MSFFLFSSFVTSISMPIGSMEYDGRAQRNARHGNEEST